MNGMNSHEARDGHTLLHERIEAPLRKEIEGWKAFVLKVKEENNHLKALLHEAEQALVANK